MYCCFSKFIVFGWARGNKKKKKTLFVNFTKAKKRKTRRITSKKKHQLFENIYWCCSLAVRERLQCLAPPHVVPSLWQISALLTKIDIFYWPKSTHYTDVFVSEVVESVLLFLITHQLSEVKSTPRSHIPVSCPTCNDVTATAWPAKVRLSDPDLPSKQRAKASPEPV